MRAPVNRRSGSAARGASFVLLGLALLLPVGARADACFDPPTGSQIPGQVAALDAIASVVGPLWAPFHTCTGVTKRLGLRLGGYFTLSRPDEDPVDVVVNFARFHLTALGLEPGDLDELVAEKEVESPISSAIHVYLRQHYQGMPVDGGRIRATLSWDHRLLNLSNGAMRGVSGFAGSAVPTLDAASAVAAGARELGIPMRSAPRARSTSSGVRRETLVEVPGVARAPVKAQLVWLPVGTGARLAWSFQLREPEKPHRWSLRVDAATGSILRRTDLIAGATYQVYPHPIESPYHTALGPLEDDRSPAVNPEHAAASPYGWQALDATTSFDTLHGNNVHVFQDQDSNNCPPGKRLDCEFQPCACVDDENPPLPLVPEPTCSAGPVCDFDLDLEQHPHASVDAAITNAFYWMNLVHDVSYTYGFDEAAGNFQERNYSGTGAGGDAVRVMIQDPDNALGGSGVNNAYFDPVGASPGIFPELTEGGGVDGVAPAIHVSLFPITGVPFLSNEVRDGAFDNGVLVHEYAHGITRRLVDPSDDLCLNHAHLNAEEGLSDFFALWYTTGAGGSGAPPRHFGFYAGYPQAFPGLREKPYSTDPDVNDLTFASTIRSPYPDGVVIGQALWKSYWKLRDIYGFSQTPHRSTPRTGNRRIMEYLTEGLRMLSCSDPDFLDIRQSLLEATVALNSANDRCYLWKEFAKVGMGAAAGYDANGNAVDSTEEPAGACTPPGGGNCGLGFELAPVLALLWVGKRRVRRRRASG